MTAMSAMRNKIDFGNGIHVSIIVGDYCAIIVDYLTDTTIYLDVFLFIENKRPITPG
jgi:hypothetical protein